MVASVVEPEIPNGNVLLSLRKAAKERGWDEVQKIVDEGRTITVTPYDANRGGLLIELEGVRGFMPVSQLSTEHYPRTNDKDEILRRLRTLVGTELSAQIIDADQKGNKLIFSEKEAVKGIPDILRQIFPPRLHVRFRADICVDVIHIKLRNIGRPGRHVERLVNTERLKTLFQHPCGLFLFRGNLPDNVLRQSPIRFVRKFHLILDIVHAPIDVIDTAFLTKRIGD